MIEGWGMWRGRREGGGKEDARAGIVNTEGEPGLNTEGGTGRSVACNTFQKLPCVLLLLLPFCFALDRSGDRIESYTYMLKPRRNAGTRPPALFRCGAATRRNFPCALRVLVIPPLAAWPF